MWPAENIMQSMRPAMLCRFPTPVLKRVNATPIQVHEKQVGEDIQITKADVNAAIKSL